MQDFPGKSWDFHLEMKKEKMHDSLILLNVDETFYEFLGFYMEFLGFFHLGYPKFISYQALIGYERSMG